MSVLPGRIGQKIYQWLDTRLALSSYRDWASHKVVPLHRQAFWYYMGGIALIFLLLQFGTGILLMVYYIPEVKSAHSSILTINSQVDFGWFIRSFHAWGSNLFILALFLHLFSTYLMKAYRSPREITWWTGFVLIGLAFTFGFSGYLLPWDEVSLFATKIGIDIAGSLPVVGKQLALLLRGGPTISGETLSRFFTLHVIVLPLLLLPVLGLHLFLIQLQGTSEPAWFQKLPPEKRQYEKFFPTFVLKDMMGWLLVINLMAVLVALFPWGVGPEANLYKPAPMGIKPEWYFLFLFQLFKLMPSHVGPVEGEHVGMLLFAGVVLSLLLIPFWDRGDSDRKSRYSTAYGVLLIAFFLLLTLWGMLS